MRSKSKIFIGMFLSWSTFVQASPVSRVGGPGCGNSYAALLGIQKKKTPGSEKMQADAMQAQARAQLNKNTLPNTTASRVGMRTDLLKKDPPSDVFTKQMPENGHSSKAMQAMQERSDEQSAANKKPATIGEVSTAKNRSGVSMDSSKTQKPETPEKMKLDAMRLQAVHTQGVPLTETNLQAATEQNKDPLPKPTVSRDGAEAQMRVDLLKNQKPENGHSSKAMQAMQERTDEQSELNKKPATIGEVSAATFRNGASIQISPESERQLADNARLFELIMPRLANGDTNPLSDKEEKLLIKTKKEALQLKELFSNEALKVDPVSSLNRSGVSLNSRVPAAQPRSGGFGNVGTAVLVGIVALPLALPLATSVVWLNVKAIDTIREALLEFQKNAEASKAERDR